MLEYLEANYRFLKVFLIALKVKKTVSQLGALRIASPAEGLPRQNLLGAIAINFYWTSSVRSRLIIR